MSDNIPKPKPIKPKPITGYYVTKKNELYPSMSHLWELVDSILYDIHADIEVKDFTAEQWQQICEAGDRAMQDIDLDMYLKAYIRPLVRDLAQMRTPYFDLSEDSKDDK